MAPIDQQVYLIRARQHRLRRLRNEVEPFSGKIADGSECSNGHRGWKSQVG